MDNTIYINVEYLSSTLVDAATLDTATRYLEGKHPNALRVDYKKTEHRGGSIVLCFKIWLNDPNNTR